MMNKAPSSKILPITNRRRLLFLSEKKSPNILDSLNVVDLMEKEGLYGDFIKESLEEWLNEGGLAETQMTWTCFYAWLMQTPAHFHVVVNKWIRRRKGKSV